MYDNVHIVCRTLTVHCIFVKEILVYKSFKLYVWLIIKEV